MVRRKKTPPVGTAITLVSPLLLARLLDLPEEHHVIGVEWDFSREVCRVYVRGPNIPRVDRGSLLPLISPIGRLTRGVCKENSEEVFQYRFDWQETMNNPEMGGIIGEGE